MSTPVKEPRFPIRIAIVAGITMALGIAFAIVDLTPDLGHLEARVLSGPERGNYSSLVDRLADGAARQAGTVGNIRTSGTVENLSKLAAAADSCQTHFALVQDGVPPPEGSELELIGRLQKSESMFMIGRDAARLERFAELRGMTIGVGPSQSGTDYLARQVFESADFQTLGLQLQNHPLDEQLDRLQRGELDLGVFVLDEDAALIREAVRERGLQLASFRHLDVIAREHRFLWHGRIGTGQYDPIGLLPPEDKRVLRVDTLVVGNGCASRTETIALLSLLSREFPGFIEHNKARGWSEVFATSTTAEQFFINDGPGLAERHVPWLVDIMAPANWVYVVMSVSLLMNLMTFWHRFRLWRIDVNRDRNDQVVRQLLGGQLTAEEIHDLQPTPEHRAAQALADLDRVLERMNDLRRKCQRQANSMLVPMGQEGSYRFQEDQMEDMLTALRAFRNRASMRAGDESGSSPGEQA